MGGLDPLTSLSQAVFPPKRGGAWFPHTGPFGYIPFGGKAQEGNPFGGCFRSSPAPDGPPNLGIARILAGECSYKIVTEFYRFFGLSCSDYS